MVSHYYSRNKMQWRLVDYGAASCQEHTTMGYETVWRISLVSLEHDTQLVAPCG